MVGTAGTTGSEVGDVAASAIATGITPWRLDEFVFRHNRRGNPQGAFQTLLRLGTNREPAPLSIVRGATDMPYFPIRE